MEMEYNTTDTRGNTERHLVVYIASHDKVPHDVVTVDWNEETQSWMEWCNYWDFARHGDSSSLIYYKSGGGGSCKDLDAPRYVEGTTGVTIWMHPMASFEKGETPINCELVDTAPIYESCYAVTANPFEHGHEQNAITYCPVCELHYGQYGCVEHDYYDEEE